MMIPGRIAMVEMLLDKQVNADADADVDKVYQISNPKTSGKFENGISRNYAVALAASGSGNKLKTFRCFSHSDHWIREVRPSVVNGWGS
jgi:hypothetical protein